MVLLALIASACNNPGKKEAAEEKAVSAGTPVTLTTISTEPIVEYTELNATSTFLQKSYVKANLNGYIKSSNIAIGTYVEIGRPLFTLVSKEARSIGNTVNNLNPAFKFSGVNVVKAATCGYITQLNHQVGDYVQDGEQLAVISDQNSFAFLLDLPYELRKYLPLNNTVDIILPDGTKLTGAVTTSMPSVAAGTQALNVVIKVSCSYRLPENLVARARIVTVNKPNATSLPKGAVLTNDVQSDFWVMKLIDSATAVKVPIIKGVETRDRVEILEPRFNPKDKILITGNYGLPDTAKVKIVR